MSGQIRQAGKSIAKIYGALRGTREVRYSFLPVGITVEFIGCSQRIPCLHALEIHFKSDSDSGLG